MNTETKFGEKYVSIEYDLWENHYKGLEQDNKYLKDKLQQKDIKISICRRYGYGHIGWDLVGSVYINGGYGISELDKEKIVGVIKEECGYNILPTKEEKERIEKVIAAAEKINKLPKAIRWLFNIKL